LSKGYKFGILDDNFLFASCSGDLFYSWKKQLENILIYEENIFNMEKENLTLQG